MLRRILDKVSPYRRGYLAGYADAMAEQTSDLDSLKEEAADMRRELGLNAARDEETLHKQLDRDRA